MSTTKRARGREQRQSWNWPPSILGLDAYGNLHTRYGPSCSFDTPIPFAHYSDPTFNHVTGWPCLTVWGAEERGLHYDYDDRLAQWDYDKDKKSREVASAEGHRPGSPAWWQAHLSHYHGKTVAVRHAMTGVNRSNGYQYTVIGYRIVEGETQEVPK